MNDDILSLLAKQCELLDRIRREIAALNKAINNNKLFSPKAMIPIDKEVAMIKERYFRKTYDTRQE